MFIKAKAIYLQDLVCFVKAKTIHNKIDLNTSLCNCIHYRMDCFTHNLDDLVVQLNTQKVCIVYFLKKNYRENVHYVIIKRRKEDKQKRGGQNYIGYMLTETTYNMVKNTYNLRIRNIVDVVDCVKQMNLVMCIEGQTLGHIEKCLDGIAVMKRQYRIGTYKADMYFPEHHIVVECDENNHNDRDNDYEIKRHNFILEAGNHIIRYNPNEKDFDITTIVNAILKKIFSK